MSRCFPFPPPGYEKKPIPEVDNVLKKEKSKEKKHKEKKHKEKREGKDKKDKEKSDRKHKEKKDKKEKHKDKKKDKEKHKDKDKDKEKGSTSVEKRVSGQSEGYNGAKSYQSGKEQGKDKNERSSTTEHQSQNGLFVSCNGEKLHQRVEKSRDKRNTSDEKNFSMQLHGLSGLDKLVQNSFADKYSQDSKFLVEFNNRISNEGNGSGSQLVKGVMDMGFKEDERTVMSAVRPMSMVVEDKEKIKDKQVDNWKIEGQRINLEDKFNGNALSQNLTRSIQNETGISKSTDRSEERVEGKDKSKERDGDDKRGDKRKSKHKDKRSHKEDKNREKEKRKEDKPKKEHKKSEKDKSRSSDKNDIDGTPNNKTSQLFKDGDKSRAGQNNLKRKDVEKNGFLHEHVFRPEKMPRLSSHPLSKNGQDLEPSHTTTLITPHKQEEAKNLEVVNKDNKINGLIGSHQLGIPAPQPSLVIAEQIAETSRKSPHPDIKYLDKVLTVPQVDVWSDVDDQAWLFGIKNSVSNKSKIDPVGGDQGHEVWAEALRIESVDVLALPYVIPY